MRLWLLRTLILSVNYVLSKTVRKQTFLPFIRPRSFKFLQKSVVVSHIAQWLPICASKPNVPGWSLGASYVQRWALCSNCQANVLVCGTGGSGTEEWSSGISLSVLSWCCPVTHGCRERKSRWKKNQFQ